MNNSHVQHLETGKGERDNKGFCGLVLWRQQVCLRGVEKENYSDLFSQMHKNDEQSSFKVKTDLC